MSAIFGEILTFGQQNGPDVRLKVFGDEHYARYETSTATPSSTTSGQFCYARLAAGAFRSTGVPASRPPPRGPARHLQEAAGDRRGEGAARAGRARRRGGRRPRRGRNRAHVRPEPGAARRARAVDRRRQGADHPRQLPGRHQHGHARRRRRHAERRNYTHNGNICSAREYFQRVSSGKLDYTNVVVGPYTLSRNRQFYVNNLLVEEALQLAVADGLDLKQFDSRNENIVDALNILYAGQTQYSGELWPHNFHINLQFGTMRTDLYLLTSLGRTAADLSIGTFCHENGHLLCRFPDMYDYGERDGDNVVSAGIGTYCLMGAGNHLDFGRSPSPVCAYLRDLVGWCDNEIDLSRRRSVRGQARRLQHRDEVHRPASRTSTSSSRTARRWTSIARCRRAGWRSTTATSSGRTSCSRARRREHYQCALLQADGQRDLEMNVNQGDGTDLFGADRRHSAVGRVGDATRANGTAATPAW